MSTNILEKEICTLTEVDAGKQSSFKVQKNINIQNQKMPGFSLEQADDMLNCLDPGMPRADWVKVMMAIKSEFGDAAKEVTRNWSAGSDSYIAKDFESTWKSIRSDGQISIGTLYYMAKENGYQVFARDATFQRQMSNLKKRDEATVDEGGKEAQYVEVAGRLFKILSCFNPATDEHPYLLSKQVQCKGEIFVGDFAGRKNQLIIPIYGTVAPFEADLQSVQMISPDGQKSFFKGSKIGGGFFVTQWVGSEVIFICEGYATSASLAEHQAQGCTVVCCFTSNNLKSVSKFLRKTFPDALLVIAGDNDHQNPANPGLKAAMDAAAAVKGKLFIPYFKHGEKGTDWNDFNRLNLKVSEEVVYA
ncbi:PriCT-2 domain-containing protein [Thiomicrorhabdus cannonii]|uniref:PriCT-2 domain-containing protein n=1 Tax=Thiomicrorhabdus cannonii TaxID=2748011 RepID=UPI0015BC0687|nr:PriCT-2 domain-containing protein [Thiomicrorhabdus cannonii]